jgi:hypothetical protein
VLAYTIAVIYSGDAHFFGSKAASVPPLLGGFSVFSSSIKKTQDYRAVGISLKRVAKICLISLNGRLAVKFSLGQPQKTDAFLTVALSACSVSLYKVRGRWASRGRICDAALFKEIPTALLSNHNFFNSKKCYDSALWKPASPPSMVSREKKGASLMNGTQ